MQLPPCLRQRVSAVRAAYSYRLQHRPVHGLLHPDWYTLRGKQQGCGTAVPGSAHLQQTVWVGVLLAAHDELQHGCQGRLLQAARALQQAHQGCRGAGGSCCLPQGRLARSRPTQGCRSKPGGREGLRL